VKSERLIVSLILLAAASMIWADDSIAVEVPEVVTTGDSVFGTVAADTFMVDVPSDTAQTITMARSDSALKKQAIYQGTILKLDLANTIIELATSKGQIQSFEMGVSWRLKQRFYPTFEVGGAHAVCQPDSVLHQGAGGFFRAGTDLNCFRRHPESLSAALVGVRLGCGMQSFELPDYGRHFKADCWGEIVLGCQVHIYKGLMMGWNVRYKILFTRNPKEGEQLPRHIPGFGIRDDSTWGFSYYIGWKI